MHLIDSANAGIGNTWVEGDAQAGIPPTRGSKEWLEAIQREPANVILAAGLVLNKGDNTQLLQAIQILARQQQIYRNVLINGDFGVRARGFAGLTAGQSGFFTDRWIYSPGTGAGVCSGADFYQGPAVSTLTGSRRGLEIIQSTGGTNPFLEQRVEGVMTLAGQNAILSLYASCFSLGSGTSLTINTEFVQHFTGGGASADVTTPGPQIIIPLTASTVVNRYTAIVGIPSVAAKVFSNANTDHMLRVRLKFPSALTYSIDLMSAQFEAGSVASPYQARPRMVELWDCQRYCRSTWTSFDYTAAPGTITDVGALHAYCAGTQGFPLDQRFNIPMRATPTIHFYSPNTGVIDNVFWEGADRPVTAITSTSIENPGYPTVGSSRGASGLFAHYLAESEL